MLEEDGAGLFDLELDLELDVELLGLIVIGLSDAAGGRGLKSTLGPQ